MYKDIRFSYIILLIDFIYEMFCLLLKYVLMEPIILTANV